MIWRRSLCVLVAVTLSWYSPELARAQSFGIELHNTTSPASGGMGGVSIARPQDVISPFGANPASLAQFRGTQFMFGGTWIEPTYNFAHTGGAGLPNIGAFAAKSAAEGSALGDIAITQDLRALGIPATVGIGLLASAGAGFSLRDVPASNGTSVTMSILQIGSGIGFDVTDRLSVGAIVQLGNSTLDAPFQGVGVAAYAYQLRGSIGLDFDLTDRTNIGLYYQSRQNFNYDDAIRIDLGGGLFSTVQDVNAGLPDNIGFGFANNSLVDGRLLLAMDILYKQWDTADLFNVLYENQWVFQFGAQYEHSRRLRLRAGYVYAENPLDSTLAGAPGGVIPGGPIVPALQYVQGTVAVTSQHRITAGVGIRDVLPGIDFDLFAGGMFRDSQQLGPFTSTFHPELLARRGLDLAFWAWQLPSASGTGRLGHDAPVAVC